MTYENATKRVSQELTASHHQSHHRQLAATAELIEFPQESSNPCFRWQLVKVPMKMCTAKIGGG